MIYAHYQDGSRVLAVHLCFSEAILRHLPFLIINIYIVIYDENQSHFIISLSLMILLMSDIIRELTHTENDDKLATSLSEFSQKPSYSLCEWENHFDNSSCSHNVQTRYDHRPEPWNQILWLQLENRIFSSRWDFQYLKIHVRTVLSVPNWNC